jgi:hypothetical protein
MPKDNKSNSAAKAKERGFFGTTKGDRDTVHPIILKNVSNAC